MKKVEVIIKEKDVKAFMYALGNIAEKQELKIQQKNKLDNGNVTIELFN